MTRDERALLLGVAEEITLQLSSRLAEIEELNLSKSALCIATFRERLLKIEDLINKVRCEK